MKSHELFRAILGAAVVASLSAPPTFATAEPAASVTPAPNAPVTVLVPPVEPEGSLELLWKSSGPSPSRESIWQPVVDPDGRIWVSVPFDHQFWMFDREGTYLRAWGEPGSGPGQFNFVGPDGNGFGGIAFRPDGASYVVDTGNVRVQEFDADRVFVREWGSFGSGEGEFVQPLAIAADDQGNVYVLDDARHDVQVFGPGGQFVRSVPGPGPFMAADGSGRVYTMDFSGPYLRRYGLDGALELTIDGSGPGRSGTRSL
jgi:DNA-binding beta-propeller fold protein YncE